MSEILSPNKYAGRIKPIRVVVVHTMEVDENDANVAEAVGNAFANPARQASAHVGVDTDSECRYVPDADTAWAAPGANADGLQIELAGRAGQTSGDWQDAASQAILERAAQRVAQWCQAYDIPIRHLSVAELKAGAKGIVGHYDVTLAYRQSSHTDPGASFPWDAFLARVAAIAGGSVVPASNPVAPAAPAAPAALDVDGYLGTKTISRWQQVMGTPVDGVISSPSSTLIRAVQNKLIACGIGVGRFGADGVMGPDTIRAMEKYLGTPVDGFISRPSTMIRALQGRLNEGRF